MPVTEFRVRLPSVLAERYVRYVIGFGVAVGVGMAPFLGKYKVPMFEALLELFPEDSKLTLIPLSAFLMGLVAVGIQFYAGEKIQPKTISRRFKIGFAAILLAFAGLVYIYSEYVFRIPDPSTGGTEPLILGWSQLPEEKGCPCGPTEKNLVCFYAVGYDARELCWPSIHQVQLSLHALYLVLTGGFGGLIGLLLLQEEARQQAKEEKEEARRQAEAAEARQTEAEEARRQAEAKKKKAPKQGKKSSLAGPTTPKKARGTKATPGDPENSS